MKHKLTESQQAEIEVLAAMSDKAIDTSDIPPLDDEFWKKAVRNRFYHPAKHTTTVQLDTDVLAWLKSQGKGYQARINEILRTAMLKEMGEN
ncbi:MAG: BrnA antitoxin family protein [Candidatus Competibacteraceae bacterium]|nr:BrnA antitoxin family protein [Candidatus Competibacteraceae bacterium]